MTFENLADRFRSRIPVEELRKNEGTSAFAPRPWESGIGRKTQEFTHWIEEQRSWRETAGVADFSHHMVDFYVEGPDAIEVHADYSVNSYADFKVGNAKQIVVTNPDGKLIGDAVLVRLSDDELMSTGAGTVANWLQYQIETGDYNVTFERYERGGETQADPEFFRYHLMGPETNDIVDDMADEGLPNIPFFNFREISVDGREVNVLRHSMTSVGLELWGDWDDHAEVWERLTKAGNSYGLRRLGTRAQYGNVSVVSGWYLLVVPAIYEHEELDGYRQWLSADSLESRCSLGGSFVSKDIRDYYLSPVEVGYDHTISFDHEFVGREALEKEVAEPLRRPVTFVWDPDDFLSIYASLFQEGKTYKFLDLPYVPWDAAHYDRVLKSGSEIGFSMLYGYSYNERDMLSLGTIDPEYADPGTEVQIVWGEEGSPKSNVERHVETEINATVAEVPYAADNRDYY